MIIKNRIKKKGKIKSIKNKRKTKNYISISYKKTKIYIYL